ncbi:MAG: SUMF1/EgtB/PvdO family nonheme iron enzyme, partial [Candidatus Limnocylindrales bacterium]
CYGGEIRTPTLDRLACEGVRLTQFYTSARCSPSRASLLTGLHLQQVGLGILTNDDRPRGYAGSLAEGCRGDDLRPGGQWHCNVWQGAFPEHNTAEDGFLGTAPVDAFAPNSYGLHNMVGNVWEWCSDWFSPRMPARPRRDPAGPVAGSARVIRGGSYLCHDSYCFRYRVAARSSNTPASSIAHTGFRVVGSLAT